MDIGIGLPATIPGVEGKQVIEWARRAEQRGFSSLGVIDRIVYPNYEPLIALAAAAAVTESIRLTTSILISPYRTNHALLAKELATIDHLSGGRLDVGIAIGARPDDYTGSGMQPKGRGRKLEQQLDEMKRVWGGEPRGTAGAIGPTPIQPGGPRIIIGGSSDASFRRAAKYGVGWIRGGGGPAGYGDLAEKVRAAWREAGRTDSPRLMSLAYFSLGPRAKENADWSLHDYYAFAGPYADVIRAGAATSEDMVRDYVSKFAAAGCDELIFCPCSTDPEQVDLLASAVL